MSLVDLGKRLLDAAKRGDTDEVRTLMSNGAPFTTDWLGTSPLHFAAQFGHLGTCEVLLRAGISRDARTKVDRTPLHVCAQEGHVEIVELLVNAGADIEAKDMLKMTPLHWAVERDHIPVIQLLLKLGADISSENKFDKSPVDIALGYGRTDIASLLQMSQNTQIMEVTGEPTSIEEVAEQEVETELIEAGQEEVIAGEHIHTVDESGLVLDASEEPVVTTGSTDQSSTSVLATLAALAEATSTSLNTTNTTSTASEALNWLETHGITISAVDAPSLVQSSIDSGQIVQLSEAGKLALKAAIKEEKSESQLIEETVVEEQQLESIDTGEVTTEIVEEVNGY